jgi:hypothetical protein
MPNIIWWRSEVEAQLSATKPTSYARHMMNEAVRFIGNMDEETFQRKTRELQEKAKVERDMAALGKIIRDEKKKAEHREGDYELRFVESFSQRFVETYCINFVFSAVILAVA